MARGGAAATGTASERFTPSYTRRVARKVGSARQELAGADVDRRVPKLRHGPGLDLADALTGELERLAHLFERAGLAAVETEAQAQDLALAVGERLEETVDLLRQQRLGGGIERRHG